MPLATCAILLVFLALSCAADVRTRRIPNALSGFAMLAGLSVNLFYFGVPGLLAAATGIAVTIAALLAPFALGGIGGGDVKMMGAVGALLGPRLGLVALGIGLVLGGVVMLAHLARLGRAGEKLRATGHMIGAAVLERSTSPLRVAIDAPQAVTLPYSIPLGLGAVAAALIAVATRGS
jgi:prepilin peptidase CpaA